MSLYFTDPQAPRSVTSFCTNVVWQAPFRAYGPIVGYDVMFVDGEDSIMITKDRDELFHTVQQRDLPNGGGNVAVQVSLKYSWEVDIRALVLKIP